VTVWDISRAPKNEFHPTQKPVELAQRALSNSSEEGRIVLDLFGGSGSTLIACETKQRRARVMELDPSYCQVIVDRWQAFTGRQAQKVGEALAHG
jgi:DNA modification methylase